MSAASADRNLLFGVLAVQLNFVSRDDLISATSRWVLDKQRPLSEIFVEQGMITIEESKVIDSVVTKHLEKNGDDPRQSLQSIEAFEAIRSTLGDLDDAEVRETVEYSTLGFNSQVTPSPHSESDPYSTQGPMSRETSESNDRYAILRTHQKGGLGRVSIALDNELNREIALKEILSAHADNEENRARFVREAEITGALEHPGVVPVYSLGQFADGRPFYAMRFIRGINLQMAIEDYYKHADGTAESQIQFRGLVAKIIHVCQALEYAHSRGVIHRDLKPGNIMLGDYGETLVVDWGLAKTLDEDAFQTDVTTMPPVQASKRASSTSTQIGRVVGTPSFMSPEQAAGRLDALGPNSDIYSLGATLYQLLTSKPPFLGSEEQVLGNVQLGRFPKPRELNPRVPRPLEAICLKAMARMPDERYQSAKELASDLERFMADERVTAYREPLLASVWRWTRNHKSLVISSALALTTAVAALSISVVQLQSANTRVRASRDQAQASFKEAERQRKIAETNFGLARDAVQEYFVTVSEETLLKQPGMQPLRDALLKQALVYYQKFLEDRAEDPLLKADVAQAYFYTGKITESIDSPAKALPHYEDAAELQKELLQESPDDKEQLSCYGHTLNAIGRANLLLGKFDESRSSFERAAETREKIAENYPEDIEAARVYANSVMNIGTTRLGQGDFDTAIPLLERAQMIRLAHAGASDTTDAKLQRDLGKGYYQLALLQKRLGNAKLAENNCLTAIDTFERLLIADPNEMSYQRSLALSHRMMGDFMRGSGKTEMAIEYFQLAAKSLEELSARNPEVLQYSAELAGVYMNLGQQLDLIQNPAAALENMEQASGILRDLSAQAPAVQSYRLDLGVALREAGKLSADAGELDDAIARLNNSKDVLSQLVKENLSKALYTSELQITNDELARVMVLIEEQSDAEKSSEQNTDDKPAEVN